MSIKYMNRRKIDFNDPSYDKPFMFDYTEELSAPSNGDTIIVPGNVIGISVALEVTGGSGKVQASITPVDEIIANESNTIWIDWDSGTVTATTQDRCAPVSALRQVNASGTTKLTLRAQ